MTTLQKPPVWRMVKEAVEALGGSTTNVEVRDWILEKYPGTKANTIGCQIIVCTVNHASRVHFSENQRARRADGDHDFLFRPSKGQLVRYDPAQHGVWEIGEADDGSLVARPVGEVEPDEVDPSLPDEGGRVFPVEAHLRDFLVANLGVIEDGLELYTGEDGTEGVEFIIEMGRIDILAVDKEGGLLVVELKVGRGSDRVCGQIMRYVGWVRRHLGKGKTVRGLVIANRITPRIQYALADVPGITAREYDLDIRLRDVPSVGSNVA